MPVHQRLQLGDRRRIDVDVADAGGCGWRRGRNGRPETRHTEHERHERCEKDRAPNRTAHARNLHEMGGARTGDWGSPSDEGPPAPIGVSYTRRVVIPSRIRVARALRYRASEIDTRPRGTVRSGTRAIRCHRDGGPPRDSYRAPPGSRESCGTLATRPGVRANNVAVRVPFESAARSPTTAPGPISATADPSTSTTKMPSRMRKTSVPASPCRTRVSPSAIVRIFGFVPPRMIELDSDALEGRFHRRDDGRGVLGAPGRSIPEGVLEPLAEVDDAGLLGELALVVVDPVSRERARANELVARAAIGIDRQGKGRPGDGGPELDEGLVRDGARRG